MPNKRVTSKMVAKRAGVSQTTVSFVLNKVKGQNISPETTKRVLTAARELGYVPDATARMLARGVSDNVALVLTRPHESVLSDEFVSYILTGIAKVFRKESYRILVEFVDEENQAQTYYKLAHGKEAIGLIVIPYNASPSEIDTMVELCDEGYPIITIGHLHDSIYSVSVDDKQGVELALQHFYNLGHRSFGAISYAPYSSAFVPVYRLETYKQFLQDKELEYREDFIKYGDFTPESAYQAMMELLDNPNPPTAVFALNDIMAFGAMKAVRDSGHSVPEDIAIIGYDGIHLAAFANPALTTVQAPNIEQGRLAGEMLLGIINEEKLESRHIELETELIIRESCGYHLK